MPPLPKNEFYEISLEGPLPRDGRLERARTFFREHAFRSDDLVFFDTKGKLRLCVYTRSGRSARKVKRDYARRPIPKIRLRVQHLGQKDWLDKWRLEYRIRPLGKIFVLVPQNHRIKFKPGRRVPIFLEPRAAFGTGTHETTRFMIRILESLQGKFRTFLDAGTGTGILSVAAWRLGAQKICGMDVEGHAVKVARENLKLNGCQNAQFYRMSLGSWHARVTFDLVAANLMTDVLLKNKRILSRLVKKGCYLAVSGISVPHLEEFRRGFAAARLRCLKVYRGKEWAALLYRRTK